jgi:hypothetical protein
MTMTKEIAAHVTDPNAEASTAAELASVPSHASWCPLCYTAGIERLCTGYTIEHHKPNFPATVVPPLDPGTAVSLRRARDLILTQRAGYPSVAHEHPRHAGATRS